MYQTTWKYHAGAWVKSNVFVVGNDAFIASGEGRLARVNVNSGIVRWEFELNERISGSSPVIDSGRIIIGTGGGIVYCIDANAPHVMWSVKTGGPITSAAAVSSSLAFVGSNDGLFCAIDMRTGAVRWRFVCDSSINTGINTSPALWNDYVLFGSDDYGIYCLDSHTGQRVWKHDTQFWVRCSPAVFDGALYGASWCDVIALDARTGRLLWSIPGDREIYASPLVSENHVIVGTTSAPTDDMKARLLCVSRRTGRVQWESIVDDAIVGRAAVVGGRVIVGSYDGTLYSFHEATGEGAVEFQTNSAISTDISVLGSNVMFGCDDGLVYCISNEVEKDVGTEETPI